MQKYVKNEKRYRLITFICLLAVYQKLIGTGRVLGTSILRYDLKPFQFSFLSEHFCIMQLKYMDEWNNKCLQLSYGRDVQFSSQLGKNYRNTSRYSLHYAHNTVYQH